MRAAYRAGSPRIPPFIFCSLPIISATSGMFSKVFGSVWAAQPVTTIFASGRSRLSRRIVWRACRTASDVTAQVFTTTASAMPAPAAALRITSNS